jgi:ABC-type amino acid transport substrate-binding protein
MKTTKILIIIAIIVSNSLSQQIYLTNEQKDYLSNKKSIKMCVDPDWEPFEKVDKNGKHVGIAGDLIRLIAQRLKIDIELVHTKGWKESLEYSKNRKCDILSFLNKTEEREKWLTFTNPIFSDPNVLIGRSERDYIEDISKESLTIALPFGTSIAERFSKEYPNLKIINTKTEDEAFKLVENKKADITLRSMIVTAYTIKKNSLFNLKIIGEPKGYENNLRIGVRSDEPILKDILNIGINTITKEDTDNIVNKHVTIVIEKVTILSTTLWVVAILIIIIAIVFVWNYLLSKRVKEETEKNIKQNELLIQEKRKAELGTMIANISHQWKSSLNKINTNNLELMVKSHYQDSFESKEIQKYASEIENSIKFMSQTMNIFLNFYKDSDKKESIDIENSIKDALSIIDIKIKTTNTTIHIENKNEFQIEAIKNEWIHIWINILNNALDSAIKNSILHPKIDVLIDKNSISIEDNCGSFDEIILGQINQNIYTKGLGIQIIKDILKKYDCKIEIQNTNDGCEITISKL